uniref:Uncharacterized protein n=1 Tax=Amphimedon queenslandica TaxID=400682 RepID=A0A1X7U5C3_AMPQE
MEGFIAKNRSNARAYYIRQCNRVKSRARIAYNISRKYKLAYSNQFHALNSGYILQKCKNWYNKNKIIKFTISLQYSQKLYSQNPFNKKMMSNIINKIQAHKKKLMETILRK